MSFADIAILWGLLGGCIYATTGTVKSYAQICLQTLAVNEVSRQ